MDLTQLDRILINLGVVASFRTLNSSTTLSGEKCKILLDYIEELKKKVSDKNDIYFN